MSDEKKSNVIPININLTDNPMYLPGYARREPGVYGIDRYPNIPEKIQEAFILSYGTVDSEVVKDRFIADRLNEFLVSRCVNYPGVRYSPTFRDFKVLLGLMVRAYRSQERTLVVPINEFLEEFDFRGEDTWHSRYPLAQFIELSLVKWMYVSFRFNYWYDKDAPVNNKYRVHIFRPLYGLNLCMYLRSKEQKHMSEPEFSAWMKRDLLGLNKNEYRTLVPGSKEYIAMRELLDREMTDPSIPEGIVGRMPKEYRNGIFKTTLSEEFYDTFTSTFMTEVDVDKYFKIKDAYIGRLILLLLGKKYAILSESGWMIRLNTLSQKLGVFDRYPSTRRQKQIVLPVLQRLSDFAPVRAILSENNTMVRFVYSGKNKGEFIQWR